FQGLQSFLLQIDIAEVVTHKADQPDAVVDLFDTDGLAGERSAEIGLFTIHEAAAATGGQYCFVVGVDVGSGGGVKLVKGGSVNFGGTSHAQSFMRTLVVKFF